MSQQELDNALSAQEAARFQVTAYDALVSKAKLDLAYTTITSPVDGLIGTTQRKVGSLVGRGENTLLNTISQVHPILFRCAIAEAEYLRIARRGGDRNRSLEKQFGVELILADGTVIRTKDGSTPSNARWIQRPALSPGSLAFPILSGFCARASTGEHDSSPI